MRLRLLVVFIICGIMIINVSFADIHADPVFSVATASLTTNKTLGVYITTIIPGDDGDTIQINSCWLQQKIGSSWVTVYGSSTILPLLTVTNSGDDYLIADGNYSTYIGTGQYRFGLVITAQNHTKTIYSNAVTF